jgi:hypothetical protein
MFILRGLHPEYGENIPFQEGSRIFLSLLFLTRQKFIKSCLGLSQPFILRISVLFDLVRWPCCFFRTVEALARGHYHGQVWLSP